MKNFVLVIVATVLAFTSCGKRERYHDGTKCLTDTISLEYAKGIELIDHHGTWIEARITNPWSPKYLLQTVALVPGDSDILPCDIPDGALIVRTPLDNTLIQSTAHISLIEELEADNAIGGVTDASFIKSENIQQRIKKGEIATCGAWLSPDIEKIIKLNPDAIFVSPYQNGGTYGHITELNIPVLYIADYMENHPLGRAEWMKYYGMLFGKREEADTLFNDVKSKYLAIKQKSDSLANIGERKRVLLDLPVNGVWYVSGNHAYNDFMIRDAGGDNPFNSEASEKIISLTPEKVLHTANDADIWIIRQNSLVPLTRKLISDDYPYAAQFKAFNTENIWGCNTNDIQYYEEAAFHPERVLSDISEIINSENGQTTHLRYFKPIP